MIARGPAAIARAVEILRVDGLVAFPTETVYGLGADAASETALARLYATKGRPPDHPVIVHLGGAAELQHWAREVPPIAHALTEKFWPGPMTLVLWRAEHVLDAVTGGQATVAVRVPAHPVALELLRAFGRGIAAPSANRFGRVSPTEARHVENDFGEDVPLILDGGPCAVGVESTIVDVTAPSPVILRPGGVTREEVETVVGRPVEFRADSSVRVPGQLLVHYAPNARVVVVPLDEMESRARELRVQGLRVLEIAASPAVEMAHTLYGRLRAADQQKYDVVVVAEPNSEGVGLAVLDRLSRASGSRVPGTELDGS